MSKPLSTTYKEQFAAFWDDYKKLPENSSMGGMPSPLVAEAFAEYLDGFNTLDMRMELLALHAAREVDREFMLLLIDACGKEKAEACARVVNEKHRHTKIAPTETAPPESPQGV